MNKVILMWFRGTLMIWLLLVGVHFLQSWGGNFGKTEMRGGKVLHSHSHKFLGAFQAQVGTCYQRVPHKLQCFTPPCLYFLPVSWNPSLNIFYVANVYSYFISFIHRLLQNISLYSWDGNMPPFCLCAL